MTSHSSRGAKTGPVTRKTLVLHASVRVLTRPGDRTPLRSPGTAALCPPVPRAPGPARRPLVPPEFLIRSVSGSCSVPGDRPVHESEIAIRSRLPKLNKYNSTGRLSRTYSWSAHTAPHVTGCRHGYCEYHCIVYTTEGLSPHSTRPLPPRQTTRGHTATDRNTRPREDRPGICTAKGAESPHGLEACPETGQASRAEMPQSCARTRARAAGWWWVAGRS